MATSGFDMVMTQELKTGSFDRIKEVLRSQNAEVKGVSGNIISIPVIFFLWTVVLSALLNCCFIFMFFIL